MKPFEPDFKTLYRTALDDPRLQSAQIWGESQVFLAVAKARSFARAAEALGLSTPTVSRTVKRLQDYVRTPLFVSSATGTQLTPTGEKLALQLAEIDHRFASVFENLRAEASDYEGRVSISVTEGLAGVFVAQHLPELRSKHPRIAVHIRTPINVADLRQNQTDIMVAFQPTDQADLTCRRLGEIHFVPMTSTSYLDAYGQPKPESLHRHLFVDTIFYASKSGLWQDWQACVERGRVVAYCDSSLAYGIAVRRGVGIGLLGTYLLSDPSFKPFDLGVHVRSPIYLVALTERLETKPVRAVYEWLSELLGAENPWFGPDLRLEPAPGSNLGIDLSTLFAPPTGRR